MEKRRVFRLSLKERKMADAVKELAESQTYSQIQKVIIGYKMCSVSLSVVKGVTLGYKIGLASSLRLF